MTWWQVILVLSACALWTLIAALIGGCLVNMVHAQRDAAEVAKWRVPEAQ